MQKAGDAFCGLFQKEYTPCVGFHCFIKMHFLSGFEKFNVKIIYNFDGVCYTVYNFKKGELGKWHT